MFPKLVNASVWSSSESFDKPANTVGGRSSSGSFDTLDRSASVAGNYNSFWLQAVPIYQRIT